jgi:hypothetical protein
MTEFINPILIKDSRIDNIVDTIGYGVFSGASQSTFQQYPASSTSTNQICFNCPIPSENTLIDRNIMIKATYKIKISVSNVAINSSALNYSNGECFQAFPINSSIKTMTASINNTSFSINSQDVLQQLLKLIEPRDLQKFNGFTPTLPDMYFNKYSDAIGSKADITGDYKASGFDNMLVPRGSHPLKSILVNHYIAGVFKDNSLKSTALTDNWDIFLESEFCEPLIISPFQVFSGKSDFNNQALTGITTINIVMNLDPSLKRFFSTNAPITNNISISFADTDPITNASLLFNFLNIQETDKIKKRNIVSYIDYPVFVSSDSDTIIAGNTKTIISQNFQINQIPDLFIICVRRPMSSTTIRHTNSFLPIRNISLNFNNSSGLLSSASTQDLYRISKINGSQQSWLEFWGYAGKANGNIANTALTQYLYSTSGSLIIINPSRDLSLPYYLSNGSVGSYNIQFKVDVINNTTDNFIPELVFITANSGIMVNQDGETDIYTGLLTKELVVNSSVKQEGIPSASYNRLVGGGVIDNEDDKPVYSKLDSLLKN